MLDLEPKIIVQFEKSIRELPSWPQDAYAGGLTPADVLRAHFLIANHFYLEGHGLGGIGPKSVPLLMSAVDRQFVSYNGRAKWTDRFDICATLFFGIIKNHAFHDANKRTAFLSALFHMHKNGWCPSISENQFEDFTVEIANNQLEKYARYRDLKIRSEDPEIHFISWFLRTNSRKIDNNLYSITFRELKHILNKYNFDLQNPKNNHIDIVKIEEKNTLLGWGPKKIVTTRVCQIGFPRWTVEVSKAAIKTVRDSTGLTAKKGVDSAAFFKGLDPMQSLIATYNRPLMNLANR